MARYIPVDRDTVYLFPPSAQDWLGKDRLAHFAERAAQRRSIEQAEYEAKFRAREAKRQSGKPPCGPDRQPPAQGSKDTDQVNATDPDSRIMKVTGNGVEQAHNTRAAVDTATMLLVWANTSRQRPMTCSGLSR